MSASLATRGSITTRRNIKKTSKNFYFITLTSNKHPQVHTVNTDDYQAMLHSFHGDIYNYCYELNQCGQLHCHALIKTEYAVFMKEKIQQLKKAYNKYHIRIDKVPAKDCLKIMNYIDKDKKSDCREIYYRIARFYENQVIDKRPPEYGDRIVNYTKENISELADYGFEYNSNNGRFRYIKYDNVHNLFID